MAYCHQCGSELTEEAGFCPNCGRAVEVGTGASLTAPKDARNIALVCHLVTFVGFAFPFGNILAPLVVWLLKREASSFIDHHGKEAINFQISLMIYVFVASVVTFLSMFLLFFPAGLLLLLMVAAFGIVMTIVAAVRASEGVYFRYPLSIRLVT